MEKILELIKQRRVWAGVVSVFMFISAYFGLQFGPEVQLVDILTQIGTALASLIPGVLALHSYFFPKK